MTRKFSWGGFVLFTILWMNSQALFAKNVTVDKARTIAELFWSMNDTRNSTREGIEFSWDDCALNTETRTNNSSNIFYVFKGANGKGFVIVSAEDQVSPILAYSFHNDVPDPMDMPTSLTTWFHRIIKETEYIRENNITAKSVPEEWKAPKPGATVVELETAKWNQSKPYNDQCPMDGQKRSLTGCVPTAIAIVMQYHKWPEYGMGTTEEYYTDSRGIYVPQRDLNHSYQWDKMPLTCAPGHKEEAKQISTLIADIGAAIQADYTSEATSSNLKINELYSHFDYNPGMYYVRKEVYQEDTWTQMLKEELSSQRPVLYNGCDEHKEGSGHMFVLDGFTEDNYFHVNWGWGGKSDGYYTLTSLVPDNRGGYNDGQWACFNLKPNTSSEVENWIKLQSPGIVISKRIEGLGFRVDSLHIVNNTAVDFEGTFRGAVTDKEGNIKEWVTDEYSLSLPNGGWYLAYDDFVTVTINNPTDTDDRIRFFYKSNESGTWNLITPTNETGCNWEVVISDIPSISPSEIENWISFKTPGIVLSEVSFAQGKKFVFDELNFVNRSSFDFMGSLCGAVTDKDGNIKEWITSVLNYNLLSGWGVKYSSVYATINTPINAGDRIRFFYKFQNSDEWHLISPDDQECCWEILLEEEGNSIGSIKTDPTFENNPTTEIYTLGGTKVSNPQKGQIYIYRNKNGKAVKKMAE